MRESKCNGAILPPCEREGGDNDWWDEKHVQCTGSHHLNARDVVYCKCSCHEMEK